MFGVSSRTAHLLWITLDIDVIGPRGGKRIHLLWMLTEFRQQLQVQGHLEMPGILVQLGHTQCT